MPEAPLRGSPEERAEPSDVAPPARRMRGARLWILPLLLASVHLALLVPPARQHTVGTYENETDFYQYYAPDSERIAAGRFPESPYQGPGYAALVALASTATGDALTSGKLISVTSAVLVGLLVFFLFDRLFGYWVGVAAQALVPATSAMPIVSISAMTDLPFLALCLATVAVLAVGRAAPLGRVIAAGALAGAAYLVRYNGAFLVAACPIGIVALDLFERPLRERLRLAAVFLAASAAVASPWLYANFVHRGSPFYNLNYLNVAMEFYGADLSQDGTRAMAARFGSLRDVIAEDPARIARHYLANVAANLARSLNVLVSPPAGLLALLGLLVVLARRPSRPVLFLLGSGALFVLMMGLSHWEMRYYLFVLVIYVGLACHALVRTAAAAAERGWLPRPAAAAATAAVVAILWVSSASEARAQIETILRVQPAELLDARRHLDATGAGGGRILARKPHLSYLSGREWVFLPNFASADELRVWLDANPVDYLLIGPAEVLLRPGLAGLQNPWNAPAWLRPVWVSASGSHVLYAPS